MEIKPPIHLTGEEFTQAWMWALHVLGPHASADRVASSLPAAIVQYAAIRQAVAEDEGLTPAEFTRAWAWALAHGDPQASQGVMLETVRAAAAMYRELRDAYTTAPDAMPRYWSGLRLRRLHSASGEGFVVEPFDPSPDPSRLVSFRRA